eukprot:5824818-Alexandrium_andersonii.AAC.1
MAEPTCSGSVGLTQEARSAASGTTNATTGRPRAHSQGCEAQATAPVSYTHLTLPTICSV